MHARILLAGAVFAALAACSPAPEPAAEPEAEAGVSAEEAALQDAINNSDESGAPADAVISGEASWSGLDVPATARLIVEVREAEMPADQLLMREEFPVTAGSPVAFSGTVSKFDLIPGGNLLLTARVQEGYAILLTSGDVDIADYGEIAGLQVTLQDPETLARGGTGQMITPTGADYTCAGEALTIAVEAGAAYVTFADGTSVKLDKLETAASANTQFSNGKMLVEQTADGIAFGRGRAVPQPCTPAG